MNRCVSGMKLSIAMAGMLAFSGYANAALLGVLSSTGTEGARDAGTLTVGTEFEVGPNDVVVDGIGVYDFEGDGLVQDHAVGLWNSSGTLIASATVPAGTSATFDDTFRYVDIAQVTLVAGETYTMGAIFFGGGDPFNDPDPVQGLIQAYTIDPAFTNLGERFTFAGALTQPTNNGGGTLGRWGGANLRIIPEPASIALLGIGGVMVLHRRVQK